MGNMDPGDFECTIQTVDGGDPVTLAPISEFTGGSMNTNQSSAPNEGPGGKRFGFNFQRSANGCEVSFSVRDTSIDLPTLINLCRKQRVVSISIRAVRNKSQYDQGEVIGFETPRAVMTMDSIMRGRGDAEDTTFSASGIGWQIYLKGETDTDEVISHPEPASETVA